MNEWTVDVDRRIYKGIEVGMLRGFIREGDPIVIVTGKNCLLCLFTWICKYILEYSCFKK